MVWVGLLVVGALACGETDGMENGGSHEIGELNTSGKGDIVADFEIEVEPGSTQAYEFTSSDFGFVLDLIQENPDGALSSAIVRNTTLHIRSHAIQREPSAEWSLEFPPDTTQVRGETHDYRLEITNVDPARTLHATVQLNTLEFEPCENTTMGSFGNEIEPVARCVAVIDGAIDDAELEVVEADVCLARGTVARDGLHTRAGDRLLTFEGSLTVAGSGSHPKELKVETTVFPTLLDEGERLTDDGQTIAFNDRQTKTDLLGRDTEVEEGVNYDISSQTIEYVQQYKEDRLLFDRWNSTAHFRLDCTPYE